MEGTRNHGYGGVSAAPSAEVAPAAVGPGVP